MARAHPSLLGLPLELRQPIYKCLFETLVYRPPYLKGDEQLNNQTLKARSAILRTCRQLREEAFLIFNSNIVIIEENAWRHATYPQILAGVKKIETSCTVFGLENLLRQQPRLGTILSTVANSAEINSRSVIADFIDHL